jgi:uncharacterized membrane protein
VALKAVVSPEDAPLTVSLGRDSEVSVSASLNAAPGDYKVTIIGTQNSISKAVVIVVKVL